MNQNPLPGAAAALFPSAPERRRIEEWLTGELPRVLLRIQAGPVTPTIDMAAFRAELEAYDFGEPQPLEELLRWTIERMEHGIVQMANPRYFGLFNPGPNFRRSVRTALPACSIRSWRVRLPRRAGGIGTARDPRDRAARSARRRRDRHFATGGSEANYTALLCALTGAHPGFAVDGARAFAGPQGSTRHATVTSRG